MAYNSDAMLAMKANNVSTCLNFDSFLKTSQGKHISNFFFMWRQVRGVVGVPRGEGGVVLLSASVEQN